MRQKRIEVDANSILKLITHYTQDLRYPMPLDAELVAAGVSPAISRWIMLEVSSDEWERAGLPINPQTREPEFYHVRYEGCAVGSWMAQGGEEHGKMEWKKTVEAPS